MPKKSKKEKIRADLRRSTPPAFTFQLKKEAIAPVHIQKPHNTSDLTAIKKDLSKTVILAALAIAAEVIIYFVKR